MQQILILGGGFAGLWSAAGAARLLDQRGIAPDRIRVTLVNRDDWHSIRVRNYERDLADVRVPLAKVLEPIGVDRVIGTVTGIDVAARQVVCEAAGVRQVLAYDRLVLALGSTLLRPPIPGLLEHGFDIDTYSAAERLQAHVADLATRPPTTGRYTAIVVGGGLTGIECATEIIATLRAASAKAGGEAARVVLVDHAVRVGSGMGDGACRVVETALAALGVEVRGGVSVAAVTPQGLVLAGGEVMPAATVVWCAGMRANALTETLPFRRDRLGRIAVDEFLAVEGQSSVFAAGDCADAAVDEAHRSVMSCQHARPMGRLAGHNVAASVLGEPMLALSIGWYTTILDLGAWGAVYTEGWDRQVVSMAEQAKRTKMLINRQRIYPPRSGERAEILAAAAPAIQTPPAKFAGG
jgi:NADH:ubiquinone reductase (H+-translocating)